MIKALVILSLCICYQFNANANDNDKIDSLIQLVNKPHIQDSLKLEILEEIAKNTTLNLDLRLLYTDKIFEIANRKKDKLWLYKAKLRFGHIYKKIGDLDEALKNYLDALTYAKELNDVRREAIIYSALGALYIVNSDHANSLKFFNKAIFLLRQVKDYKNLANSLTNSAQLYKKIGEFDSALLNFNEAGIIYDSIHFDLGKGYNLGNIGLLYAEQGKIQKARENLKMAIKILSEIGDFYPVSVYELSLADIDNEDGELASAINHAHYSLKIAKENSFKEQISDASLMLSILFAQIDSFKNAFTYHKQYIVYRDSINNEATIQEMADLRTEYQVAQKQAEVDLLETKRERQKIIFAAMIVLITLLTFLVFLYYRNYKRKQTLNYIITERKEEIEAQRDQLQALNETKEKFLSIVSHDLLGPVNSFKGLSTIMKASIETGDIKDLQQIHRLFDQSVNNLSNLLTNLLDWSVTQQGNIPYQPEAIVVSDLVNELLNLFSNMAATKNIQLQSTIANHSTVWADKNSLKTILRNLVSNAIKFTKHGGEITVSNLVLENTIGIQVTDNGIGMPQEKIDQLLSQDSFNHSQGTTGEKGIGLGLQLVKEFTETNKGTLSIESKEGVGTTITVYLPTLAAK